jgi:WD40 repeat protein
LRGSAGGGERSGLRSRHSFSSWKSNVSLVEIMALFDFWRKLCRVFGYVPANWSISDGDQTDGPYRHGTSILGLSFSPDDQILALAGGGCIPGADGSIRLIDVATQKNVRTLHAHVCGVHDVSFDPQTGILASASFDYAVHLWDLEKEDVIFLRGQDDRTKGDSKFTRQGSLLAIGEYDYYSGPHSFYIYDLKRQKNVFEFVLPDGLGVTALALSPASTYLAVSAGDQNSTKPSRLYLVQLGSFEIVREHVFEGLSFYDLSFAGNDRLIGGVSDDDYESHLLDIDVHTGAIRWRAKLGGIGVHLACHPTRNEVAVGFENPAIRIYDFSNWSILREHTYRAPEAVGSVCSLAYSNRGNLLAYGLSSGNFGILDVLAG